MHADVRTPVSSVIFASGASGASGAEPGGLGVAPVFVLVFDFAPLLLAMTLSLESAPSFPIPLVKFGLVLVFMQLER